MATEVTFNPQGTPLGPTEAFYRGMDQSMSMMERAQSLKNQTLAQKINETKLAQWEVEAPLRSLQLETNMAEAGTNLYAAQDTLKTTRDLEQNSPSLIEMMKDADVIENDEDGEPKYNDNFVKWGKVVSALSPYSNTTKGKQMIEAAKAQQMQYRMAYANVLDFREKKLLKEARLQLLSQKPSDRTGALTQEEIDEFEAQTGQPSGFKVGDVKRISRVPGAGISIGEPALPYREPSAQGTVEFEKQYGTDLANRVNEVNLSSQKASQAADNMLVDINTLEGLYETGLTTGEGQEYLNMFGAVALRLGVGNKDRMATQQEAQRAFADMALNAASVMLKGQGQVTENERAMVERAVASAGNSPAANLAIMKTLRKAAQRAKEAGKYNIQLQRAAARGEIKTQEIPILMDEWYAQHSVGAEALEQILAREARNSGGGEDTGAQHESALDYVKRIRQQRGAK